MIKHIIVLKLKENAGGKSKAENAQMLKREFEGMTGKIREIRGLEVGINFNSTPDAYDMALTAEFATQKDLDTYLNHPEHQRIVAILRQLRESRIVVDYEL